MCQSPTWVDRASGNWGAAEAAPALETGAGADGAAGAKAPAGLLRRTDEPAPPNRWIGDRTYARHDLGDRDRRGNGDGVGRRRHERVETSLEPGRVERVDPLDGPQPKPAGVLQQVRLDRQHPGKPEVGGQEGGRGERKG